MPELLGTWGGGMPELLGASGGICRNFCGIGGGCAETFVCSRPKSCGIPPPLAHISSCIPLPKHTKVPAYPPLSPQKFRHTPP